MMACTKSPGVAILPIPTACVILTMQPGMSCPHGAACYVVTPEPALMAGSAFLAQPIASISVRRSCRPDGEG
jgi:hypothetical protein